MLKFIDILAGLAVAAIWGGNFLMAKLGLDVIPPFMILALRFICVALILLPFVPKTTLNIKDLGLIALTLGVLHHGLLFLSIWLKVDLSASIIIIQSSVPLTAILGAIFLGEKISQKIALGIVVAFAGILTIAGDPETSGNYFAVFLSVISAAALALFNIQVKKLGQFNILSMMAYSSIISSIMLLSISLVFETTSLKLLVDLPLSAFLSIFYMVFSSVVGFGLWFRLLQNYPVASVAPFLLLVPVFGLSFAIGFMNKMVTDNLIIGSVITITGVAIITLKKPKILIFKPKAEGLVIESKD
ncbi:MAG: eamA [Rickettsiaceae bacterium]|jgi:O-acetylserine/cysteine efflux transporter|nr:eamA [Rickettsiaceae bacterium]